MIRSPKTKIDSFLKKGVNVFEIGVEDGEMLVESKGLHLYGYAVDLAKLRCLKGNEGT